MLVIVPRNTNLLNKVFSDTKAATFALIWAYFGMIFQDLMLTSIKVRVPSEHEHVRIIKVRVSSSPSTPKYHPSERVSEHARCSAHP